MNGLIGSVAVGACLLALSAGVAFADNLHPLAQQSGTPNGTGQTGSNVFSSCQTFTEKSNTGTGSPFNPADTDKRYAGNAGNPTGPGGTATGHTSNANTNTAVSQYDNACAQKAAHTGQLP